MQRLQAKLNIAGVSYLNAKPLIYGLDRQDELTLSLDVPSKLAGGLASKAYDVALLPVIDYQRQAGLKILTAGGICSDGETLTVRIFSRVPVNQIQSLACDTDSHTSVALARILLAEHVGIRPQFVDLSAAPARLCDARLLIGDKVICDAPAGFPHQMDLGAAWKEFTGLPFAFAIWTARADVQLGNLAEILESAKKAGLAHLPQIVEEHAVPKGWPRDVAMRYLSVNLQFDIGPRELEAMALFHKLAHKHGLIEHEPWGMEIG